MKHYIYLTEDKLYYIRKENRARGYSFMGSRTITGPETVTGAMESLADIYNLKGRAVVLAIEASVKIHFMSLPASSKKTALQMAENSCWSWERKENAFLQLILCQIMVRAC